MARLIPGRIRNEGIALSEAGKIDIKSTSDKIIKAEVDGVTIHFSFDDDDVSCSCPLFAQKNYCQHLAAVEYYLKNSEDGKKLVNQLKNEESNQEQQEKLFSFGSLFLDGLSVNEDDSLKYRLSASGEQDLYLSEILWTLHINRLPDSRSYIIRDIKTFLQVLKRESVYQIGKNYYEALSYIQFDEDSQEFIDFLWRVIPDEDLNHLDYILPNRGRHLALPRGFFEEGVQLMQDLYAFQLNLNHHDYKEVYFKELTGQDGLFTFEVIVHRQFLELVIQEKSNQSFFDQTYLFYHHTFYHLSDKQQKLVQALKSLMLDQDLNRRVHFGLEDQSKLAASLLDFAEIGIIKAPKSFAIRDFTPIFNLEQSDNQDILLEMTYDYDGELIVRSKEELKELPFTSNFKREEHLARVLAAEGFIGQFSAHHLPLTGGDELYHFFNQTLPRLEQLGTVHLGKRLDDLRYTEKPQVQVTTEQGLLDISFDFSSIHEGDVSQALKALFQSEAYYISDSGHLVVFDEETQRVSETLRDLRAKPLDNGHLQLDSLAAFQLSELFKDFDRVDFSADFRQLAHDLTHPEAFEIERVSVQAQLRDYQVTGVKWLSMLDHYKFGGILADDMGLGKTLQTIAFLTSKIKKQSKILILSPSGLIYNWKDEFEKFAPNIDVVVSYGLKQDRDAIITENHQVTITSYASFRQDFEKYQVGYYDYLILDEAQVMKNTQTKIAQYLRAFEVGNCFALSGTPIENKLLEIWSIFQIILPGLLPSKKEFSKLEASQVAQYIKPFVMRRKKEDVLPELPELIESTYYNELADKQKAIYLAQLRQIQSSVSQSTDFELNRQKIEILAGITRLRQICDTPALFMDYQGDSGKLASLRQLLSQIQESGHRTLIFSQFRDMLDIAEEEAAKIGLTSYKITGSTPAEQRQEMTKAFNNGSKDVFLVSLKAGGVGLNLTGADTVILIDLWWNPAVEMQAISRAHRIGQQQNVEVYRLITRGTIEEKILELQDSKKNLVTTVLDGDESRANMTIEEIKEILGIKS
ncbi:DEAD/DEAH box helicase [Streptococcus dentapri]|uniref:SNF2 helicase associated domain-containing protein n=1 Tax=Streptococcus dentapri TaxID=573564 RepID=A0ABV8D0G8_9STRE